MTLDKLYETIAKETFGERACIVTFPDGSQSVTTDPYTSIANYITVYLHEHNQCCTDHIIVLNDGESDDNFETTICYGTADGTMCGFLHDFYEGQKRINLLAFASIDDVGKAMMTDTAVTCIRKD